ncbi:MAG TPA: autotransporter-associated beta strand repeat-containing protein [Verrucomicrobiae bacterium]|nr:autotransporter-associated beta strand repeat-containing protein [Verrucomicrobiae bacterium]
MNPQNPAVVRRRKVLPATALLLGLIATSPLSHAADVFKADNVDNLNLPESWDGLQVPDADDVAAWDNRVATAVPQELLLGADLSWAGIRIIDPASAITLRAGNTLTLGAAGIDTTLASQPLVLSNAVVIGAPQVWNVVSAVTLRNGVSGTDLVTKGGSGTLTIATISPTLSRIQIDEGTVSSAAGNAGSTTMALNGGTFSVNAALSTPVDVMENGGVLQNTGGNRTLSGPISGTGSLTVNASSTFTWAGSNSYSGTATIQGSGAVRLSNLNAVSSNATYVVNAALNGNAAGTFHLGALHGSGFIGGNATHHFSIGALNGDSSFSGAITTGGSVTKVGTGTLVLDGANTYGGPTIIADGVLQIGNGAESGRLGSGAVSNSSALVFNHSGVLFVPNAIHGAGGVTNIGFGKVALTGSNTYSGTTRVSSGTMSFGSPSLATGALVVDDFANAGVVVTSAGAMLTQGNATFGNGTGYEFDLGTFGNHPGTVVSNTGTLTLNSPVTVNVAGTNFSVGSIALMRYANRGGAGNFLLGTLPSNVTASLVDDQPNKVLRLNITAVQTGVDLTFRWIGTAAGEWDIDNPANAIWRVVGTGQLTNYTDGAAVLFDDTATGTTNINITTFVSPFSVAVNNTNKAYTLGGAGSLSGGMTLTKAGPGTLIITNANSYSGATYIQGGSLVIAGENGSITGTVITNSASLVIDRTEATNALPSIYSFGNMITGAGTMTILGVDPTNTLVEMQIGDPVGNPYSGGTVISNAFVRLNANPSSDATRSAAKSTGLGTGKISFLGESVLEVEDFGAGNNSSQAGTFVAPLEIPAGQIGSFRIAGRMTVSGPLAGAGILDLHVSYIRAVISGDWSGFAGQVNVWPSGNATGNQFQIANAAGLPLARVHLTAGVTMGGNAPLANNSTVPIGELSGDAGSFINVVGESSRTINFSVGGLNTSSAFAGNVGGPHSLTKVGSGTFTLSGANDFTGTTTVSNGVLALAGESGLSNNPAIRLSAPGVLDVSGRTDATLWLGSDVVAQTLSGHGAFQGSLFVGNSGTMAVNNALAVSGKVVLGGTTVLELNRASSPNSGRIVAPTITAGGVLIVTNAGGTLQAGDTFQLFSTPVTGFASVSLPLNDPVNQATYTWENRLAIDGSVVVLTSTGSVNPNPASLMVSSSGGNLTLAWPDSHKGWILETNSVGLSADAWFEYPGSAQTNSVDLAIDRTRTNVFYRLVLP